MARLDTRTIIEGALVIALAVALNLLGAQWPFGGKLSLGMLPIIVFALRRGPVAGLMAGALFGMVDLAIEPFIVHPVQLLLDYPVPFGLLGLVAGLFSGMWRRAYARSAVSGTAVVVLATAAAVGARFAAHWLSGVIFFSNVAGGGPLPNGTSPVSTAGAFLGAAMYSLLYNAGYLLPSAVITAIAAAAIMPALERIPDIRVVPEGGRP